MKALPALDAKGSGAAIGRGPSPFDGFDMHSRLPACCGERRPAMVGTLAMHDDDNQILPPLRGRFAYAEDEGFRVLFRRADGALPAALAWGATALVLGVTLVALLQEPAFNGIAWMIGGLIDFSAIYVIHALRSGLSRGGLAVDGSERRIFLPEGAEVVFERLLHLSVRPAGERAELVIFHDTGELRFGVRPADEVEIAAQNVARVAEIPRLAWSDAAGASAPTG